MVIRDGLVLSVTADGTAPAGARVWDCAGLTIYPAFVDAHVAVSVEPPDRLTAHWNANMLADRSALDAADLDPELTAELRSAGFAVAALAPDDGIFRGSADVVLLDELRDGEVREPIKRTAYHAIGFEPRTSQDRYPKSQMGAIALIRQTLSDVEWHHRLCSRAAAPSRPPLETSRRTLHPCCSTQPTNSRPCAPRKSRPKRGRAAIILGSGREFRRLDAVRRAGIPIVTPLTFPAAPRVASLREREQVTLRQLLTWEHAPTNPRRLLDAGIRVALTTSKLESRAQFHPRLRQAMLFGLDHDRALAALTTTPGDSARPR